MNVTCNKFSDVITGSKELQATKSRALKAFAKNPENPRQIERLFMEKIYKGLQFNRQEITFRRIMREVVNEFEAGHFDALSANPIKIPSAMLKDIRILLEQDPVVKRQLHELLHGLKSLRAGQKRRCLDLLIYTYVNDGLPESEIREPNVPFLQQLDRSGLITKVLEGTLVWKISKNLYEANRKIIKYCGLSLEDYLLKAYSDELPEVKQKPKPRYEEIDQIEIMLTLMERRLAHALLSDAKSLHLKILRTQEKYPSLWEKPAKIISECVESLAKLTSAYMSYERIRIPYRKKSLNILWFWKDFWWSPETIQQFVRAIRSELDVKRKAPLVLALYREAFPQVFNFFKDEYENSKQFHIPLTKLKNQEIKLLHGCRYFWRENKYKEIADRLVNAIERKLRTFLYDIFSVLYGDFEHRIKWLDKDSKNYIVKNTQKDISAGFSLSNNEFQQLSRAQYRNIMTGVHGSAAGRRNWKCIFSTVFNNWDEKDLDNYLSMLAEISIRVAHLKDESIGIAEQDYVYKFMQKSTRFLMSINQAYLKLLNPDCFRYTIQALFSLNNFNDIETLTSIEFTTENVQKIQEVFERKSYIRIPLDDQEYIEGFFGLDFRKTYAILALLSIGTIDESKGFKIQLKIVDSKGSEIRARLSKIISWASVSYKGKQR